MRLVEAFGLATEDMDGTLQEREIDPFFKGKVSLRVVKETDDGIELDVMVEDRRVGFIELNYDSVRRIANVELSGLHPNYQGRGIGSVAYPMAHRRAMMKHRLALASDSDGNRSEKAEALWRGFVRQGMARYDSGIHRYVMGRG